MLTVPTYSSASRLAHIPKGLEYPLASGYRYAGEQHAARIPCFALKPLATIFRDASEIDWKKMIKTSKDF